MLPGGVGCEMTARQSEQQQGNQQQAEQYTQRERCDGAVGVAAVAQHEKQATEQGENGGNKQGDDQNLKHRGTGLDGYSE